MKTTIITVAVLLTSIVGCCWYVVHPPVPKDAAVIARFRENRTELLQFIDFITKQPKLKEIGPSIQLPREIARLPLSADGQLEVRRKIAKTGFDNVGIGFGTDGPSFEFIYMSAGLVTGGVTKGLVYAQAVPKPVKGSLDDMGWKTYSHVVGYRQIEGPWYVFFRRD